MPTTQQDISEESSSRSVRIREGELDLQLHYNEVGAGDRTVILLHGSGPGATGWSNFHRNVDPLVAAGYRVILLDMPGWGKSDPILCTSSRSDLNARALKGFMDARGVDKAHLVGNSMGGHTAVAFALAQPARTGKLVLMGGGTGGVSSFVPTPTEGIKLIGLVYREPTMDNIKRLMNVFVFDPTQLTDALLQGRLENMQARREHLENFVRSTQANPRQFPDLGHRLGEIANPTLVIWGRDDRFVPLDTGLRLLAGLQDAELHVFSKCGHWAQWEHADRFNRMVVEFLGR
jgi:2-hydroxy-6-oxonona-2,4-dienedioate hydrolase